MKINKPVRVTVHGRHQGYLDLHRTFWGRVWYKTKVIVRSIVKWSIIGAVGYGIYVFGGIMDPSIKYEKVEAIKEVEIKAPILERIADCESGQRTPSGKPVAGTASHYGKSGQVLMVGNDNKSVDVGKYAINSVWFAKANELGYDLTKEEDNYKMAMWIYTNRGTGDWASSANCWK